MNASLQKDFYKTDHRRQYPEGTNLVYSNFTPRSNSHYNGLEGFHDDKIVWFGLQCFMEDYLQKEWNDTFFHQPKAEVVGRYKLRMDAALGEGKISITHIEELHDLGYLPIRIKALEEGTRVPMGVPVLTIVNTLPSFFWLTNALETVMSAELWKPTTTATIAYDYYKILSYWAKKTGAPQEFVPLQGHDFSFRGMSGRRDAAVSGMGHLLSFVGTDSIPAIEAAVDYYQSDDTSTLIGCSVPATEHSVMCMGEQENEVETFRRLITELYPTGIISVVSDTWDFWQVITDFTVQLKNEIMTRQPDANGLSKVVFRPDSGDPVKIVSGYRVFYQKDMVPETELGTEEVKLYDAFEDADGNIRCLESLTLLNEAEVKGAVECLWGIFGGTETAKGFKVLDDHVGLIYGDSITPERADAILKNLHKKGFASSNIVFGIGSYTYQYITRDTFGFAMKATYGEVNGIGREIMKDPKTDNGTKKSAKGLLSVNYDPSGELVLEDGVDWDKENSGELKTVFEDGGFTRTCTFEGIRKRLHSSSSV